MFSYVTKHAISNGNKFSKHRCLTIQDTKEMRCVRACLQEWRCKSVGTTKEPGSIIFSKLKPDYFLLSRTRFFLTLNTLCSNFFVVCFENNEVCVCMFKGSSRLVFKRENKRQVCLLGYPILNV